MATVICRQTEFGKTPERIESEAATIIAQGCYLLSLGGDHYVTGPLLKAHAEKHGPLALIQFDAHQDTWEDDGEQICHGTFVTRAVREGIIDPERSIQIGIRTHAPEDYGIEIVYGDEVEDMTAEEIANQIKARVGNMPCYISFDIDCLDCAYAPGTGTPVSGGPSSAKMLSVLRKLGSLEHQRKRWSLKLLQPMITRTSQLLLVQRLRCICSDFEQKSYWKAS